MHVIETRTIQQFEAWLRGWSRAGKRVALVLGPVGSGKTTTITYVASRLGYRLVQPESVEHALRLARVSPSHHLLIHLDRPYEEGWRGQDLKRLARTTLNPVAIEDLPERRRYYRALLAAEIIVDPPRALLIRRLRSKGRIVAGARFKATSDLRQLMLMAEGAGTYEERDWARSLEAWLRTGKADGLEPSHLPAILDTVVEHCYGWECVELIALLLAADLTGRPAIVLDGRRPARRGAAPVTYYYERLRAAREMWEA